MLRKILIGKKTPFNHVGTENPNHTEGSWPNSFIELAYFTHHQVERTLEAWACSVIFLQMVRSSMQERSSSVLVKPVSRLSVSTKERHLLPREAMHWVGSQRDGWWASGKLRMADTVPSKLESVFTGLLCSLWPASIHILLVKNPCHIHLLGTVIKLLFTNSVTIRGN